MLGAINRLPAVLAIPLRQIPTLPGLRPPRGLFCPRLPPSFHPPVEGLEEGREAPSVVNVKEPRVSSPTSMSAQEHGERRRDTAQVRGGEGDASSTSLATGGGGGNIPSPSRTP